MTCYFNLVWYHRIVIISNKLFDCGIKGKQINVPIGHTAATFYP